MTQHNHIGQKVIVYFGFERRLERTLYEDFQGLYINYKTKRVPVRPKPHSQDCYLAHPNYLKKG